MLKNHTLASWQPNWSFWFFLFRYHLSNLKDDTNFIFFIFFGNHDWSMNNRSNDTKLHLWQGQLSKICHARAHSQSKKCQCIEY